VLVNAGARPDTGNECFAWFAAEAGVCVDTGRVYRRQRLRFCSPTAELWPIKDVFSVSMGLLTG
jgi:hypothetical protein